MGNEYAFPGEADYAKNHANELARMYVPDNPGNADIPGHGFFNVYVSPDNILWIVTIL
jgi:hypothetical protein